MRDPTRVGLVPASNGTPRIAAKAFSGAVENGTFIKVSGPANGSFALFRSSKLPVIYHLDLSHLQ
ncbi:hypothetical protein N9D61_09715 [Planktomarina sp.]|nr:hypothetical protein [Planktomarina sp.]